MKLEQNEKNLLFSYTELPDVFFTEYLSMASGDNIKVYLYILFLSKYNKDIKITDLSKVLSLPFPVIQESIKFWEDLGLIVRKNNGYIVKNIQEIALNKLYNPKITSSPEDVEKNSKNQYRARAIESINSSFFQGVMSPSWYNDIILWFNKYGFDEQVMISLFNYCYNKSALHRNYVQTVADSWSKNNIKTFSDLDLYYQKYEKMTKIKKLIAKKLGLSRELTQFEEAYIEKWTIEYGYDMSIIEIALRRTTSKANPSFDYIDKLLTDWKDRNLKTAEEINKFLQEIKVKNKNIKTLEKKSGYNNYEQRKYENFDALYANKTSAN